jgi:hypothetical protein
MEWRVHWQQRGVRSTITVALVEWHLMSVTVEWYEYRQSTRSTMESTTCHAGQHLCFLWCTTPAVFEA